MTFWQSWKKFALRRRDRQVTTWKLRFGTIVFAGLLVWGTRGYWIPATARSLTCSEDTRASDLILVDNSEQDYLAFEKAANLRKAGIAAKVAVPVQADPRNPDMPHAMFADFTRVMSRVAWLGDFDMIPVPEREPITLNVAYRVREYVTRGRIRSVTISVPAFRSRRTMLIYETVMRDAGVTVRCAPVFGLTTAANWTSSWHGIEDVVEQFIKLQYYRLAVLPFVGKEPAQPSIARAQ